MKKEIRRSMKLLNLSVNAQNCATCAISICERIEKCDFFKNAAVIALFASLPDEIPTGEIISKWAKSKIILLPRVEGDKMQFFEYIPQEMVAGSFGISEPQGITPYNIEKIDLMIIPGVAFTRQGDRLGRGKGYYDKYLSNPQLSATTVGVCYGHQLLESLPTEEHDIRLDYIIASAL